MVHDFGGNSRETQFSCATTRFPERSGVALGNEIVLEKNVVRMVWPVSLRVIGNSLLPNWILSWISVIDSSANIQY